MKSRKLLPVVVLLGAMTLSAYAGEEGKMVKPPEASSQLARIKALSGKWRGTSTEANGSQQPAEIEYHVTSGGSAVVETLFPGTEHEMVSVYHDQGGKLSMTHYCMLGNQPELGLVNATPNEIQLSLAASSPIAASEPHMHSLNLALPDADHLTQTWAFYQDGKFAGTTTITVAREK